LVTTLFGAPRVCGRPVLERARDVRPDVILLDARLADRDSLELGHARRSAVGPRGLVHRARELISQAAHHNTAAACVVFAPDLEGEPSVELLQLVGRAFQAGGRRSDPIGRVGQREFAVVAPGTDAVGAVKLAQRFRHAIPAPELRAG
jgi:hypothetical protein